MSTPGGREVAWLGECRLDGPPTDQPWGTRDISLTDPDGFKITIAVPKR